VQFRSSAAVVVGLIQVSVRQKRSEKVVGVDQIRQCSRMRRLENGADVESANSEVCWARTQFNVTRKEEKGEEKRTTETECALASKEQKDGRLGGSAVGKR